MVADIKSERWPASNRNRWPDCVGIRKLLPTPPHGDAVAFGYTVTTNHGGDLHPTDKASSRTH
jgi:hypothetical protein